LEGIVLPALLYNEAFQEDALVPAGLKPWQQACEATLRERSRADALRFWGRVHEGPEGPEPPFDYRFEHTQAVVRLARWLCPQVGADPEVVECAAWLHDLCKRLGDPGGKDTHARDAAEALPDVLEGTDFPESKRGAVRHAILHHVGLSLSHRLEPLETACLWDADKLSKLGAASLAHFSCISGAFQPVDTAGILARGERWIGLAEGITASMNTPPAQEEARRRLAFLKLHYGQLRREWANPMEEALP
jgi:uncharacterized protein